MEFLDTTSNVIDWCGLQGSVLVSRGVPGPVHYLVDDFLPTLAKIMIAVPYALGENFHKLAGRTLGQSFSFDLNVNLPILLVILFMAAALLMVVVRPQRRR
ncbi:MAG TPA: hypothetical protein VN455_12735 [Methanotrichaceae archaeon]|nr:hypothetical protein [Methanotrichaceae archaeon]